MSRVFQGEVAFLGVRSSPAFVRAPEGNACAERYIRTLKENLLWGRTELSADSDVMSAAIPINHGPL